MAINLRNIAFWMLDFLTGNKVKKIIMKLIELYRMGNRMTSN